MLADNVYLNYRLLILDLIRSKHYYETNRRKKTKKLLKKSEKYISEELNNTHRITAFETFYKTRPNYEALLKIASKIKPKIISGITIANYDGITDKLESMLSSAEQLEDIFREHMRQ